MRTSAFLLLLLALALTVLAGDEVRDRRRVLELAFAPRYMEIAAEAKRAGCAEVVEKAYGRADFLDPGDDAVITFDPEIDFAPGAGHRRRWPALRRQLADLRLEEARARLGLAEWCDDECLVAEALAETLEALALDPGPLAFDEEGVLRSPGLGELPLALSLAVLVDHEVYRERLVRREDLPSKIRWSEGWTLDTAHFHLETNHSGQILRTVGRALEAAREVYAEETGFDVEEKITVYILAERSAYEAFLAKMGEEPPEDSNIGKCKRDLCAVDGSRPIREVVSVCIHEVAHGYFNLGHEALTGTRGVAMPTWYAEGLATYCAGYGKGSLSWNRGEVDPAIARDPPIRRFQELVRVGQAMPLGEFLMVAKGNSTFYYQAYAFYWFLRETRPEAFRKAVDRLAREALTEKDVGNSAAIFVEELAVDPDELQQAFLAWVAAQETAPEGE